ncbi:multidrug resistance-associated protein 1 [Trichonephila clavipes]|nr:multidrug resistance-associated protein 1 [Trichonephila clavipes]
MSVTTHRIQLAFSTSSRSVKRELGEAITVKEANFSWTVGSDSTLKDINLHIPKGSLFAVIGPVGSGKSSLISALLGEMHKTSGSVDIKGAVAYVPQQAWILNQSLRENILLVKHMREEKYSKILDSCCLRPDLEILPSGDATEIGEKGLNLSGGQKQRISIARAVYQDKDIYLLDDPLSAVDVHVRKALFDDVISYNGILRKKTRILVTHDVSLLHKVDKIVSMKDGRIDEIGSYMDLLKKGGSFTNFVQEHTNIKAIKENLRRLPRSRCRKDSLSSNETVPPSDAPELTELFTNFIRERANIKSAEENMRRTTSSTRPGTPQLTNCERMKAATYDLRQSAVLIELQETTISTLRIQGLYDDAVMTTILERLTDLQVKHQIAEIPTLPNCSPSKSVQEYPPLLKTTAVKRKEKEDGFSSPPTRKLSKNKRTKSNSDLNFKIILSNKFSGLENLELTIEPVAGTSTDKTAINLPSNKNLTGNNKTTQDDTFAKKLPPPVMLKIPLNFRDQMKRQQTTCPN